MHNVMSGKLTIQEFPVMSLTIGVDIGGTKIAAGVVDVAGRLLAKTRRETSAADPEAIETAVADAVAELRAKHEVASVGVAAAGFIDAQTGSVLFAPNLAWRNEPLRTDLQQRIGLPVSVENDANAAVWGEYRFGAARGVADVVLVTVGTGVGGGLVVNGELVRGRVGLAGELGHIQLVPNGIPCGCGNFGCWEQYASGNALERMGRELLASDQATGLREACAGHPEQLEGPMITAGAMAGDAAAIGLLAELGDWLGKGMAQIAAVLDPALFVIGGGVIEAGELLLKPAQAALVAGLTGRAYREPPQVVAAALANDAGLIGAADLARTGR